MIRPDHLPALHAQPGACASALKCFYSSARLAHFLSRRAKHMHSASGQSANKNTPFFTDAIPPFTYNYPPMAYLP